MITLKNIIENSEIKHNAEELNKHMIENEEHEDKIIVNIGHAENPNNEDIDNKTTESAEHEKIRKTLQISKKIKKVIDKTDNDENH